MTVNKIRQVELATRRAQAAAMRTAACTWQEIADALGYSSDKAAQVDVSRALNRQIVELAQPIEEWRQQQIENLRVLKLEALRVMNARHVKLWNGEPVIDEATGEPYIDSMPNLAAADRLLKIEERLAKLLGTEAPVRQEVTAMVKYEIVGVDMSKLS